MISGRCRTSLGQCQQLIRQPARTVVPRHCSTRSRRVFGCSSRTVISEIRGIHNRRVAGRGQGRTVRVDATPFIQGASVAGKGGIVFIAGATGPISIRLLRDLATLGFKVVAGVPDLEEASVILNFGTRFELIARNVTENILVKEAPIVNIEAMVSVIPKGARVVVVDNDGLGKSKTDPRGVGSVLQAAAQAGASQVILISPLQGDTGTSFFLFGQGSASSKASERLSRLERQVVESGVPYTIVRVAGLTSVKEPADTKSVLVGPAGTFPPSAPPTPRDQLTGVLASVLTQSSAGSVLEVVPNTEAEVAEPLAEQVGKAVATYRASIAGTVQEAEARPALTQSSRTTSSRSTESSKGKEEEEEAAKPASAPAFFGFGAPRKAPVKEEAEPEPEAEAPKKAPAPFFAFGARKAAPAKMQEEVAVEEAAPAPKPAPLFSFGPRKAAPAQKEEEAEEKPPAPKPAPLFSFGARKAPVKKDEEAEEKPPTPKPAPFFSFGSRKAPVQEEAEEEAPAKKAAPLFAFGSRKVAKQEVAAPPSPRGRVPAKAVPVKAGRDTQSGTLQVQKVSQRGAQKPAVQKPVPKKAPLPAKKAPLPPKRAPPARGSKQQAADDEDEPPKKGFRLFPL